MVQRDLLEASLCVSAAHVVGGKGHARMIEHVSSEIGFN